MVLGARRYTKSSCKKPDNVDRDYIVLLSNPIEEGTVQCIVEKLDLVTGNTAGQDGDTLVMR